MALTLKNVGLEGAFNKIPSSTSSITQPICFNKSRII